NTTVPVTVTEEASAWIDKLGMRHEFEQMLEHVKQTAPERKAIEVTLEHDPCPSIEPGILIAVFREDPGTERDRTDWDWGTWMVTTFPPEVCATFTMMSSYGAPQDGR